MRNTAMNTAKDIEQAVASLTQSEFAEFRVWFADFNFDNWDTQIKIDIASGETGRTGRQCTKIPLTWKDQRNVRYFTTPDFWNCFDVLP